MQVTIEQTSRNLLSHVFVFESATLVGLILPCFEPHRFLNMNLKLSLYVLMSNTIRIMSIINIKIQEAYPTTWDADASAGMSFTDDVSTTEKCESLLNVPIQLYASFHLKQHNGNPVQTDNFPSYNA